MTAILQWTTANPVRAFLAAGLVVLLLLPLAAWLPGDGTARDEVTGTEATWTGAPAYAAGKVAQAFSVRPGNAVALR